MFTTKTGELRYRAQFKNAAVIEPSALGISVGGVDLGKGVLLGDAEKATVDENYTMLGNHTQARNHYTIGKFPVEHKSSGRSCPDHQEITYHHDEKSL